MWSEIKKHPFVVGGAVFAVIVVFLLFGSSGGAPAQSYSETSDVAAGDAANNAALAANVQISGQQTALQALQEQIGGAISIANIQAQSSDNANQLAASVALANINASSQTQALHDTLAAQTVQAGYDRDVSLASISSNTTIQQTNAVTQALVAQAQINAQTAQAAIQASSKGLFSRIFG